MLSPRGSVVAFDRTTGKERWRSTRLGLDAAQAAGRGKVVYIAGTRLNQDRRTAGRVSALDAVTGRVLWSERSQAPLEPTHLFLTDNLVIVGESDPEHGGRGVIEAFEMSDGKRVWSSRLSDGRVTSVSGMPGANVVTERTTMYFCDRRSSRATNPVAG